MDGLVDDIVKHTTLKSSQKVKLRKAIKNLKKKHSAANEAPPVVQSQVAPVSDCKEREIKEDESKANHNNNNNNNNLGHADTRSQSSIAPTDDLTTIFECDTCGNNMKECELFYCTICSTSKSSDGSPPKYYCKNHILYLHKENKKCKNHYGNVIESFSNNRFDNRGCIQQLTFDLAKLQKSKQAGLQSIADAVKQHIYEYNPDSTVANVATKAFNFASDGAFLVKF